MQSCKCVLVIFAVFAATAESTHYSKCKFAEELLKYDMPGNLSDWVCIAQHASDFKTHLQVTYNPFSYSYYGAFQISDEMCGIRSFCPMRCSDMTDLDGLNATVNCAVHIYNTYEFDRWPVWEKKCQNYKLNCRLPKVIKHSLDSD